MSAANSLQFALENFAFIRNIEVKHRESGNFRIVLAFAIGGVALLCSGYYYFAAKDNVVAKIVDPQTLVNDYAKRVNTSLSDAQALNASVARNPNPFSCLYSINGDCSRKGGVFQLYESADSSALALSQLQHVAGLTKEGQGCMDFPSVNCPLKIEAFWTPICAPGNCENTKSFHVEVSIRYESGVKEEKPIDWKSDSLLITPIISLAKEVACSRSGGTFQAGACLSQPPAERLLASQDQAVNAQSYEQQQQGSIPPPAAFICPQTINVQGTEYPAEFTTPGRAQVHVPSTNNCPNAFDAYVFTCGAANPANFENEGTWAQADVNLAPPCDESGHPLQEPFHQ